MKKISLNNMMQIFIINVVMALFWNLSILSKYTNKSNIYLVIFGTLIINLLLIYEIYIIFYINNMYSLIWSGVISFIKNKRGFLIICIIFITIFLTISNSWLNLDGFIYYKDIRVLKGWEIGRFDKLTIADHNSQAYIVLLLIGEFLTPNNVIGARTIHCIMALLSIFCMYEIVSEIVKKKDEPEIILYTSIFAFSPMLIGLVCEINTDFPLLCFFTYMVCCGIKKKYILQAMFGLMLCFSKEPGVLLYGCYILGILIYRCIKKRKIFSIDIWIYSIGGILWILNYIISKGAGWISNTSVSSGTPTAENVGYKLNTFAFFPEYIIVKFRELIFLNSYWILYFLILVFISITLFYGRKFFNRNIKLSGEVLCGIILSFAAFLAYNFFYITYPHYRYLLPFAFFVSFGTVISIADLVKNNKIRKAMLSVFVLILLASNFYTFDPFSKYFFQRQGTGNGEILIPSTVSLGYNYKVILNPKENYYATIINTSGMYNLQYAHLGLCFDKTLEYIDYDENTLIIMPQEYRDEYGTIASIFGINLNGIEEIFWDNKLMHTNINCADHIKEMSECEERYKLINLKIISNLSDLTANEYKNFSRIYYIELPFMKEFNHNNFLKGNEIIEDFDIQYLSWKWKVDRLK